MMYLILIVPHVRGKTWVLVIVNAGAAGGSIIIRFWGSVYGYLAW